MGWNTASIFKSINSQPYLKKKKKASPWRMLTNQIVILKIVNRGKETSICPAVLLWMVPWDHQRVDEGKIPPNTGRKNRSNQNDTVPQRLMNLEARQWAWLVFNITQRETTRDCNTPPPCWRALAKKWNLILIESLDLRIVREPRMDCLTRSLVT